MTFAQRVQRLPHLGIGVSTEYGAAGSPGALDVADLRQKHPEFAGFLEVGLETTKGLDGPTRAWRAAGLPTTYHFLDVNLDEPEDFDGPWLEAVRGFVAELEPAWLCGDAGLWHFGPRDRGHMLLLPPILTDEVATAMAEGIIRLREETGREVLPENPPGHVFLGDLHLLDFFARVCERADTGLLLDAAHLALYQRALGHAPLTGLDAFPLERVVEVHVAGAGEADVQGLTVLEDDHTPAVLPDTWQILGALAPAATELRAVVFECERNALPACLPGFERIAATLAGSPFARGSAR
ncbi:MAG: DUF692 family protein [bacterium]